MFTVALLTRCFSVMVTWRSKLDQLPVCSSSVTDSRPTNGRPSSSLTPYSRL